MMQGLLVHGSNHFIVNGPKPSNTEARELVRRWEVPKIGQPAGNPWRGWTLCTNAIRENLSWATVVSSEAEFSPAVQQLLAELQARGIVIENAPAIWK
jgi:hypothetical protein